MRKELLATLLSAMLAACGGGGGSSSAPNPGAAPSAAPTATATPPTPKGQYQPLAVGDQWTYACGLRGQASTFTKTNSVVGTHTVGGVTVYDFALQVVTSPSQITTQTMLVADDAQGNLTLYGYVINGAVQTVTPAVIAEDSPSTAHSYNYTAPDGTTVTRTFMGIENSNRTPYNGVNVVAPYFESNATHDYGYARGIGIVEEDHGPNYQYDCLLQTATIH